MSNCIRFATIGDKSNIMQFIGKHWKEGHVLSHHEQLFLYEYQDIDRLNFVISATHSGRINGILGFIKSSDIKSDIWLSLWKVSDNKEHPMLGVELLEFLRGSSEYGVLLCSGINDKALQIYKYLGIYTGVLKQFVLLNNQIRNFKVAKVSDKYRLKTVRFKKAKGYSLEALPRDSVERFDFDSYRLIIPSKSKAYFIKRYFNHPIYRYKVYGICKDQKILSLLVTRSLLTNDAKVLRIVDYIGSQEYFQYVMQNLYEEVVIGGFEYLDFMCFGFDDKVLLESGFLQVDPSSEDLIIPNYFSPFIPENVRLNFLADTNQLGRVRVCLADGDQDRPSS